MRPLSFSEIQRRCPLFMLSVAMVCVLLSRAGTLAGEPLEWPQFRGAGGRGAVTQGHLRSEWSNEDYRWTADLPGMGIGSFAIYGDHVYLVNADPDQSQRSVIAFNLVSGKREWEVSFPLTVHPLHARNTFASSTPVVDDSGVYVAWADPQRVSVVALGHDGSKRWTRDLGRWQSEHGFATSPTLLSGRLILLNSQQADQLDPGQQAGQSSMIALAPDTGITLWETPLTTTRVCYGVPALLAIPGRPPQVVAATDGDGLFGLDSESGRMLWQNRVFTARCVSSPLVLGDLVIGSAGSGNGGNHLVAVRPAESTPPVGTVTEGAEVYRMKKFAPYVPTPAVVGKKLAMVDDKGIASLVDGETGEPIWSERIGGNFSASPVVVGDRMLIVDLDGVAHVLRLGEQLEILGKIDLGGPVQATPAFAQGCLLLRVGNRICCLGPKVL